MPPAIARVARGSRGAPGERKKSRMPNRTTSHKFRAQDFVRKRQNDTFEHHYTTGKLLGEGQFGEVFVGTLKRSNGGKGDTRAIKRIQKDVLTEEDHEEVFNEFSILRQMDHPCIAKMYEFFEDKDNFWFVQELCGGGELLDELERIDHFSEEMAALIMQQVLSSVHYCHSQKKIVHRDLKLENILLHEGTQKSGSTGEAYNPMLVKVIDFGLATTFTDAQILSSPVGSMHYIAPEVLEQAYGHKCDVWSCGVISYILLSGFAPFEGANDRDMRELIMMGNVSFADPIWKKVSDEAKDFVKLLLTYEPDKRPEAGEALKHAWIKNAQKVRAEQFKANKGGTDAAIKALENCRIFESNSKLKQATCVFMTSQYVLSGAEKDGADSNENSKDMLLGEIFRAMDLDADGRLSREELRLGFLDFFEELAGLTIEEVDDIFSRMDLSSTGYIDYSEFMVAAIGLHDQGQAHNQKMLKNAFQRLLDNDASGFISKEKVRQQMVPFYGEDVDEAIIQKIIDQADEDKDGRISWEDFLATMSMKADFKAPPEATPLENWVNRFREGSTKITKSSLQPSLAGNTETNENADATPVAVQSCNPLNVATLTPPPSGRKTRSNAGAKSRLISAIFEKNLEKNRAMGIDTFQYIRKKEDKPKRKLPRTRRVNFEDLTKKATTKVNFDAKSVVHGRNKEIEQLKSATSGRARERRATIVNMLRQENEESRFRKEARLKELEMLKRRGQLRSSFQDGSVNPHKLPFEGRERRQSELVDVKKSLIDSNKAKKLLFEQWNMNDEKPSLGQLRRSQVLKLEEFQKHYKEPEKLKERIVKACPCLPVEKNLQRGGSRSWTRRLSGKSLLKDSLHSLSGGSSHDSRQGLANTSQHSSQGLGGSSHHSRQALESSNHLCRRELKGSNHHLLGLVRSVSQENVQDEHVEARLIEMQPEAATAKSARTIEPIRRLNSFDSDQEQHERDQRLDKISLDKTSLNSNNMNEKIPATVSAPQRETRMEELKRLQQRSTGVAKNAREIFEGQTRKSQNQKFIVGGTSSLSNSPKSPFGKRTIQQTSIPAYELEASGKSNPIAGDTQNSRPTLSPRKGDATKEVWATTVDSIGEFADDDGDLSAASKEPQSPVVKQKASMTHSTTASTTSSYMKNSAVPQNKKPGYGDPKKDLLMPTNSPRFVGSASPGGGTPRTSRKRSSARPKPDSAHDAAAHKITDAQLKAQEMIDSAQPFNAEAEEPEKSEVMKPEQSSNP